MSCLVGALQISVLIINTKHRQIVPLFHAANTQMLAWSLIYLASVLGEVIGENTCVPQNKFPLLLLIQNMGKSWPFFKQQTDCALTSDAGMSFDLLSFCSWRSYKGEYLCPIRTVISYFFNCFLSTGFPPWVPACLAGDGGRGGGGGETEEGAGTDDEWTPPQHHWDPCGEDGVAGQHVRRRHHQRNRRGLQRGKGGKVREGCLCVLRLGGGVCDRWERTAEVWRKGEGACVCWG